MIRCSFDVFDHHTLYVVLAAHLEPPLGEDAVEPRGDLDAGRAVAALLLEGWTVGVLRRRIQHGIPSCIVRLDLLCQRVDLLEAPSLSLPLTQPQVAARHDPMHMFRVCTPL